MNGRTTKRIQKFVRDEYPEAQGDTRRSLLKDMKRRYARRHGREH